VVFLGKPCSNDTNDGIDCAGLDDSGLGFLYSLYFLSIKIQRQLLVYNYNVVEIKKLQKTTVPITYCAQMDHPVAAPKYQQPTSQQYVIIDKRQRRKQLHSYY